MNEGYRLRMSIVGILAKEGKADAVTLPVDTLLTVSGGLQEEHGIVKCFWNGGTVSLLICDLRHRSEPFLFEAVGR